MLFRFYPNDNQLYSLAVVLGQGAVISTLGLSIYMVEVYIHDMRSDCFQDAVKVGVLCFQALVGYAIHCVLYTVN